MLAILTYHSLDDTGSVVSVAPRAFAAQMSCLAEMGILGISLREAVTYRAANGDWPAGCVVLTFDDGYANFYEGALPALAQHGFTGTLFITSGHVGGYNDWAEPPRGLGLRKMLSWQQVTELAELGIEIGAHTRTHSDLRHISEQQIEDEVAGSRVEISARVGQPVESFAYPSGQFGQTALAVVKREFRAACTTVLRRAHDDSLHLLPRIDVFYLRSPLQLQVLLAGRLDYYLAIRRLGRSFRNLLTASHILAEVV